LAQAWLKSKPSFEVPFVVAAHPHLFNIRKEEDTNMPRKPVTSDKEEAKVNAAAEASAIMNRRARAKKEKGNGKMYAIGGVCVAVSLLAVYLAVSPEPGRKGGPTRLDGYVNDQVAEVTSAAEGNFTAAASPFFNKWTLAHAKYSLGGISVSNMLGISGAVSVCSDDEGLEGGALPPAYDARDNYEGCFSETVDSGNCSASYAIAATEAIASRFCISDNVKYAGLRLSAQQILSCDKKSRGCNGGGVDSVWSYIQRRGLYPEECVPYAGEKGAECTKSMTKCDESKKLKVLEHCILTKEKAVKREIYNRGPVVAPLYLKAEYLVYGSGVYSPTPNAEQVFDNDGKAMMTAVNLVGWGKSQGTPYWIVKHSWGSSWGENGYARVDMNGVVNDNYVVVGVPATEEAIEAAEAKKMAAEARKEEAKKERALRDERILENRQRYEEEKKQQQEEADDKDMDDDDFEAEVDLDADDGESPSPADAE